MNTSNKANAAADQQILNIPEELYNSADKILAYAMIPYEKADLFRSNLELFSNLKNKSASDSSHRQIADQLSAVFYEVYTAVFKRVQAEDNHSRLYQMFLRFGYMDERLLGAQHCNTLYKLVDQEFAATKFPVFDLPSWLTMIYDCSKDPSINEFGHDYYGMFQEKKKRGEVTEQDKYAYDADYDGRLKHEIENFFKLGQRLCYGQIGSFCPILHKDMITRDLESSLVTPARLEASLNKIMEIDYSAFHREIVFTHSSHNISPELVMKPVLPEIILMPIFGHRSVMWQVLSGKSKSSPGRYIFPLFTDEDLDGLMIDTVAKFRWDLSKNMSGSVINKANEISLYADYSDYVQFYAKNRDLSGEAKERLKVAIKRHRNNPRDIFMMDYHTWINYESKSLLRLNKVARDILFKHCPFSKSVCNSLAGSPVYSPMILNLTRSRIKQIKILEARYAKVTASGSPLDPDLADNLAYYKS